MTWIAAAVVGGSLITGAMGADAAQGAADTQASAANAATAQQKAMYDTTTANVKPWLDAGQTSLNQLMAGVTSGQFTPSHYGSATPLNQYTATSRQDLVGVPPTLSTYGAATPMSMFGSVGDLSKVDPAQALQAYQQYTAQNPYQSRGDFTTDKFQQDPGYQFQLQQGLDALTNKASLAGGMNSNNMKGLIGYAEGLAGTTYNDAFNRYQTEAGRSLNEYQTGLQDYIQQFLMGQNVTGLNNQVTQQNWQNKLTGANFNNAVTQQKYQDDMSTTSANNAATQQNNLNAWQQTSLNNNAATDTFKNLMAGTAFNNSVSQQMLNNANQTTGLNNQVIAANDANSLQRQQLNNQSLQQIFANLSSLSELGLGAGLKQGVIGATVGQSIGDNIIGAGNAQAAGQIGTANAITGALGQGYNGWLMSQFMNPSGGSFLGNNQSILNQGLTPNDLYMAA